MQSLNARQQEAVTSHARTTIVIAGPGSGKTRVLTHRIAWHIEQGVDPQQILAVTFTNKAALEMQSRLEALLGPGDAKKVTARTFHSFGARFLRKEMRFLAPKLPQALLPTDGLELLGKIGGSALKSNYAIYDDDARSSMLKTVVCERLGRDKLYLDPVDGFITSAKNDGVLPNDKDWDIKISHDPALGVYVEAYWTYTALMLHANALDFDDLILLPRLYMSGLVADRTRIWQSRYRAVLVDEFQDTNLTQAAWLQRLTAHPQCMLTVVGDEDQSIYGFRNARPENVRQLMQRTQNDQKVVILEQNYRSGAAIVEAANNLIGYNDDRVGKTLVAYDSGGSVEVCTFADHETESQGIVDIVRTHLEAGVSAGEIAILYRQHALSRAIETAFVRASVPYAVAAGTSFYDRREIRDVLAYLQVLQNGDSQAVKRIINRPKRGIGAKTEAAFWQAVGTANALEWLETYHSAGQRLGSTDAGTHYWKKLANNLDLQCGGAGARNIWRFSETIAGLLDLGRSVPVDQLISAVIEQLEPDWQKLDKGDTFQERRENALELLTVARGLDPVPDVQNELIAFLDQVALVTQMDDIDDEPAACTLATLHAAKGCEWDVVLIAAAEDNILPHRRSIEAGDVEEERRLFYVGVTRARHHIYVTNARLRMLYGDIETNDPSSFIREMEVSVR